MAGLGITHAIDILAFAFIPSRQDTVELQNGLLAASALPNIDPALDTALARAPATVRIAFAQLVTGDGGLVVPLPVPSAFVGLAPRGFPYISLYVMCSIVIRILSPPFHFFIHSWRSISLLR